MWSPSSPGLPLATCFALPGPDHELPSHPPLRALQLVHLGPWHLSWCGLPPFPPWSTLEIQPCPWEAVCHLQLQSATV